MLPVWLFMVLMVLICYLLYVSTTEGTSLIMKWKPFKKIQYWMKEISGR